ncbi:hypothetical protein PTTG_29313 [Puccinia triticina 1-1 BBBD Race 1]|uniref:Uncharacterized protein n=1 Tax=Puccinia triticina (isolate 1-1 / race 1 (BBBD)) TaxID=630390 RepID=A0A180G509_PUCT1|nr:hypothetical protein PTTG_29313 [Puccinia triticina 1-1 BBBD Race 1]
MVPPHLCQGSGPNLDQRKRKDCNPSPARGIATSAIDGVPKRPKQTQTPTSLITSKATDQLGPSLSDRITNPVNGASPTEVSALTLRAVLSDHFRRTRPSTATVRV